LSDLASSCEYLNIDKTCTTFSDDPKAKANRQLKCQNSQKISCCYLCIFRSQCAISCKYLGQYGNYTESKHVIEDACTVDKDLKVEASQLESVPVAFCFSCNVEMVWAKTQFTVDNWHGNESLLADDKALPVTVLLCPRCGKIEFKADLIRKDVSIRNGSS